MQATNPEKDQIFIFNKEELSLIKNTFAENEPLLLAIRKVLLQFPLTASDKALLSTGLNEEVIRVLRKRMLPTPSPEFPITQIPNILSILTEKLKHMDAKEMELHFEAIDTMIDYLTQQFAVLAGGTDEPLKLESLRTLKEKDARQRFIDTNAYLNLMGYIDPMLMTIKVIAGSKDETPEQQAKRMTQNSNK